MRRSLEKSTMVQFMQASADLVLRNDELLQPHKSQPVHHTVVGFKLRGHFKFIFVIMSDGVTF